MSIFSFIRWLPIGAGAEITASPTRESLHHCKPYQRISSSLRSKDSESRGLIVLANKVVDGKSWWLLFLRLLAFGLHAFSHCRQGLDKI